MKPFACLLCCGALLSLSGCLSANLEDAAPPVPAEAAQGPRDTGEFPDLNEQRTGALDQISEEERAALLAEIEAAGSRSGASRAARSRETGNLGRIARTEQEEALRAIEGE